jgi:hypothetical protein
MPTPKHSELESKFDAPHVTEKTFDLWCAKHRPLRSETTSFPDFYYSRGTSVVRHRMSGGAGELTVKMRKSETSITDRVEIDLTFGPTTTDTDVISFLEATGWKEELWLSKHFSKVYWFKHGNAEIAVSLYEVEEFKHYPHDLFGRKTGNIRRMLEVEVEKGSDVDKEAARTVLSTWCSVLTDDLGLGVPLDRSLYEIYTGKRYELRTK